MQAIERIRVAMYHESDDLEFACNPAAMTEVLAHIDALTAELAASDIAIAEYRQQRLDNAAEIARLRIESEERLQNCAALIAENEQLRKDAERNPMHEGEIQAAWLGHGIEEPMPYTFELGIRSAERFNGIKGTP